MDRRDFFSTLLTRPARPATVTDSTDQWQPSDANPWDRSAAKHLFHRMGIAASKQWLDEALAMSPHDLIDSLMDDTLTKERLPEPVYGWEEWLTVPPYMGKDPKMYEHEDDIYHRAKMDIANQWTYLMAQREFMFRERMLMFWSDHFVIQDQKVYHTQQVHRYLMYFRKNAWGNFKQMVKEITILPAMLVYLDGVWSEKDKLNENYARELMELFTMGITDRVGNPNYSQQDVRQLALALTGWRFRYESPPPDVLQEYFAWYYFDYETKTSPWGAEPKVYGLAAANDPKIEADVLDVMFELRADAIAWHISKKLYDFFLHRDPSTPEATTVIEKMAARFKQDWELKPVIQMLLHSEHFFDPAFRGAIVKSPYEFMLGFMNQFGVMLNQSRGGTLGWQGKIMGQWLINPVNVKGWPGHRTWLTSGTLVLRTKFLSDLLQKGAVESYYIDAHTGFDYNWIHWDNGEVLAWAGEFSSFQADVFDFLSDVSQLIFAIEPSAAQINEIIDNTISFPRYEWPAIPAEGKVPIVKRLLLKLTMLPEYQLS